MSTNPKDIKSQHELNPCNDGKRSSDVLVETISKLETTTKENELFKEIIKDEMIKNGEILEEIERLQKQLDIAVKGIKAVLDDELFCEIADGGLIMYLYTALERIEELNNGKSENTNL